MRKNTLPETRGNVVPIPPELTGLPTIEAKPWFQLSPDIDTLLEGPAFDSKENLFVTSPTTGTVFKITSRKKMSVIFRDKNVEVDGSAFHRDGRLFIVCLTGELLTINPDNYKVTFMYPKYRGKSMSMNDLVFDSKGNIYFTDFTGTIADPAGGVFRMSSYAKSVKSVVLNLASPNGISLSPEGNMLWVAESARSSVLRITLLEDGVTCNPVCGVVPAYYSTGCPGPDSNKIDSAGNIYQCIMGQGRIIILNVHGIPIANVVVPGRDEGKFLKTTNLAFKPGTREGYITTSGEGGAWIYTFTGLAKGLPLFSHQSSET